LGSLLTSVRTSLEQQQFRPTVHNKIKSNFVRIGVIVTANTCAARKIRLVFF